MTRIAGTTLDANTARRVRAGAVGGVILFGPNIVSLRQVRRLTAALQQRARMGGNPPLLIAVDQEGGAVRRLRSLPPGRPPGAMARTIDPEQVAREAGAAAGVALRGVGINVDLAPVADVGRAGGFLGERAFGGRAPAVAMRACAFAEGIASAGVIPTLKHFPGLGAATVSTDAAPVVIAEDAHVLVRDLAPYRRCGSVGFVMVSSARYPNLTGGAPAVLAKRTYDLLRSEAGRAVITISDDLQTPALAAQRDIAARAVRAGLDVVLNARTVAGSQAAFDALVAAARTKRLRRSDLLADYRAIVAAKRAL